MAEQTIAPATTPAQAPGEPAGEHLEGRMGIFELVVTVLAFSAPVAVVSGYVPFVIYYAGAGAPSVYVVAALVLVVFSVGFTTMTRYISKPGAFYAYVTAGLGRVPGLAAAFMALFSYGCLLFSTFSFFGVFADQLVQGTLSGPAIPWYVYGAGAWGVVAVLAYLKIELSAKVLSVAMVLEVVVILVFDAGVLIDGGPQGRSLEPFSWGAFSSGSVGLAVLFGITCFLGFESTAIFREEDKTPRKTIPRATYIAVIFIGLFYIVASWTLVTAFGHSGALKAATDDPSGMFNTAMGQYVGKAGVDIVSVLMVTSIFAAMLSGQNILARYLYNLGLDRALPAWLGHSHPRFHSPYRASVAVTIVGALMNLFFIVRGADAALLFGRWAAIGAVEIIGLMLLTSVSVFVFFRRSPEITDVNPLQTVVAPLAATVAMGLFTVLSVKNFGTLIGDTGALSVVLKLVCLGVILLGGGLALFFRARKPEIYQHIGRQTS